MPKNNSIRNLTILTTATSVLFLIFWFTTTQVQKIRVELPFTIDPYDVVGSIGFQIIIIVLILNLLRFFAIQSESKSQYNPERSTYLLRGSLLILISITAIMFTDTIAELKTPITSGTSLDSVVSTMITLISMAALISLVFLVKTFSEFKKTFKKSSKNFKPFLDLINSIEHLLQKMQPLEKLKEKSSTIKPLAALSPRKHPNRFCIAIAILAGLAFATTHALFEPAPKIFQTLLVSTLFFTFEFAAAIISWFVFGKFLGIKPE